MIIEPYRDPLCSNYSFTDCYYCPEGYHYILENFEESEKNVRLCQHNSFMCEDYSQSKNKCTKCEQGYRLVIYQQNGRYCKKGGFWKNYSFYTFEGLVVIVNLVLAGYIMKDCFLSGRKNLPVDVVKKRRSISPDFQQIRAKLSNNSPELREPRTTTTIKKLKFENPRQKKGRNKENRRNGDDVSYNILNTVESEKGGLNLETHNF